MKVDLAPVRTLLALALEGSSEVLELGILLAILLEGPRLAGEAAPIGPALVVCHFLAVVEEGLGRVTYHDLCRLLDDRRTRCDGRSALERVHECLQLCDRGLENSDTCRVHLNVCVSTLLVLFQLTIDVCSCMMPTQSVTPTQLGGDDECGQGHENPLPMDRWGLQCARGGMRATRLQTASLGWCA